VALILAFNSTEIIFVNVLFFTIILSAKMMVIREILATPFKVNFKMHYPMVLSVLDNIVLFVLILFIPFVQNKILYFIIAYTVSNLPGFILSFYYLYKKFNYKYKVAYENFSWIIKESLPLFGFVILSNIFQQIDIVILSSLKGNYDVGIYSAGVRLTMPLNIIPGAIVTSVFPILVKKMADEESTEFITNLVIKLLFFISFVIASVFSFGSAEIVRVVFGREYASSSFSASILYWCQIFIFFTYYSLSVLIANNKQHYNFIFGLVQVLINLVFILLLVPNYSFVGASIAKLIASFVGFVYIIYVLSKLGLKPSIGRYKMLLWSGLLALILWLLSDMPLVVYLTLSAIVIFILTIGLKFFEKDEIIAFFKLVNREEMAKNLLARFKFLA
jgi:O-antigen/teichoic acid export membrane protein